MTVFIVSSVVFPWIVAAQDPDQYQTVLDAIESAISAGQSQVAAGRTSLLDNMYDDARAKCAEAHSLAQSAADNRERFRLYQNEREGRRKSQYILRFEKLSTLLRSLESDVAACLEGSLHDPPTNIRQLPEPRMRRAEPGGGGATS